MWELKCEFWGIWSFLVLECGDRWVVLVEIVLWSFGWDWVIIRDYGGLIFGGCLCGGFGVCDFCYEVGFIVWGCFLSWCLFGVGVRCLWVVFVLRGISFRCFWSFGWFYLCILKEWLICCLRLFIWVLWDIFWGIGVVFGRSCLVCWCWWNIFFL